MLYIARVLFFCYMALKPKIFKDKHICVCYILYCSQCFVFSLQLNIFSCAFVPHHANYTIILYSKYVSSTAIQWNVLGVFVREQRCVWNPLIIFSQTRGRKIAALLRLRSSWCWQRWRVLMQQYSWRNVLDRYINRRIDKYIDR